VGANFHPMPKSRTAIVDVAGERFTVTQAGR